MNKSRFLHIYDELQWIFGRHYHRLSVWFLKITFNCFALWWQILSFEEAPSLNLISCIIVKKSDVVFSSFSRKIKHLPRKLQIETIPLHMRSAVVMIVICKRLAILDYITFCIKSNSRNTFFSCILLLFICLIFSSTWVRFLGSGISDFEKRMSVLKRFSTIGDIWSCWCFWCGNGTSSIQNSIVSNTIDNRL